MGSTAETGARGEREAAKYLSNKGFAILHRNWRHGRYELDIIALKNDTIHFVEVKCRKKNSLTTPEEAITEAKFRSLSKAAEAYITSHDIDLEIQFDLIAVEYDISEVIIKYVPNAMISRW